MVNGAWRMRANWSVDAGQGKFAGTELILLSISNQHSFHAGYELSLEVA